MPKPLSLTFKRERETKNTVRFQEEHPEGRILRETGGDHCAGRSRPDDHNVAIPHRHGGLQPPRPNWASGPGLSYPSLRLITGPGS